MLRLKLIVLFALFVFGCIKKSKKDIPPDVHCVTAEACVGNKTNDTIFYGWNTNMLEDTLLPGQTTCLTVGDIDIEYNKRTGEEIRRHTRTIMISSSWHNWFIEVDECHKRSNFEYDPTNPISIKLYSE